jgi:hypothetical protein
MALDSITPKVPLQCLFFLESVTGFTFIKNYKNKRLYDDSLGKNK